MGQLEMEMLPPLPGVPKQVPTESITPASPPCLLQAALGTSLLRQGPPALVPTPCDTGKQLGTLSHLLLPFIWRLYPLVACVTLYGILSHGKVPTIFFKSS